MEIGRKVSWSDDSGQLRPGLGSVNIAFLRKVPHKKNG